MPDLQSQFVDAYGDQGLVVVALDPDSDDYDDIAGVRAFAQHAGVRFPVGVESTSNYELFQENFDGVNPYPTDVIVDKNGIIRYVAVEYDPAGMAAVVEQLLAE